MKQIVFKSIMIMIIIFGLSACGGGRDGDNNHTSSSKWDTMKWDQGQWK